MTLSEKALEKKLFDKEKIHETNILSLSHNMFYIFRTKFCRLCNIYSATFKIFKYRKA